MGRRGDDLFFNHGGGGYGFLSWMAWYPTLDIGISVLTNSAQHDSAHIILAQRIIDHLVDEKLVSKAYPLTSLPVCKIQLGAFEDNRWYFGDHFRQAAWRQDWERYTGRYRLTHNATARWYGNVVLAFGLPRKMFVKVKRDGNGMTIDGEQLIETEPGLFFSMKGEALDFRSDPPTWRNIKLSR